MENDPLPPIELNLPKEVNLRGVKSLQELVSQMTALQDRLVALRDNLDKSQEIMKDNLTKQLSEEFAKQAPVIHERLKDNIVSALNQSLAAALDPSNAATIQAMSEASAPPVIPPEAPSPTTESGIPSSQATA